MQCKTHHSLKLDRKRAALLIAVEGVVAVAVAVAVVFEFPLRSRRAGNAWRENGTATV
jgi:hypothetical protein